MAMFDCPECGKNISDKAAACPNCGAPIAQAPQPYTEQSQIYQQPQQYINPVPIQQTWGPGARQRHSKPAGVKPWMFVVGAFALISLIIIIGSIGNANNADNKSPSMSAQSNSTVPSNNAPQIDTPKTSDAVEESNAAITLEPVEAPPATVPASARRGGEIGDFEVYVVGLRFVEGYSGEHMVAITYRFTNNSSKSEAFWLNISATVFQDGVELDTSFMKTPGVDSDASSREIRPGVTIDVEESYILSSESDIEIDLDKFFFGGRNVIQIVVPYSEIGG